MFPPCLFKVVLVKEVADGFEIYIGEYFIHLDSNKLIIERVEYIASVSIGLYTY
jgi:hypothetical protein